MIGGRTTTAQTKFGVPHVPHATVQRDALVARLDATTCPLSLVVAAPGSGKTSLLSQWVARSAEPVAWLSCDALDADPQHFFADLATAVRSAWPDIGPLPSTGTDAEAHRQLVIGIANALAALGRPGAIVIDDFHAAGAEPDVMAAFVEALPLGIRLVLGSRHDPPFPVSRLRLQGRLLELRQAELRLTADEARSALAALGVDVSDAQLARIAEITEGWTAAVHLAGLWLRAHPDADGLLQGLVDTDRSLVDFLVNEVIELQPPDVVEFLSLTAELGTFDAALCDAVRSRDDSAAMLRRVEAANLFLARAAGGGARYRYHPLFARFLQARLRAVDGPRVAAVHRAAADAYVHRGDLMSAVQHSMAAGDVDGALVRLWDHVRHGLSLEDRPGGAATARAWLRQNGGTRLESSPRDVLACTVVLSAVGHPDDAAPWLHELEAREDRLDDATRQLLHCAWSFHLLQTGDPAAALDRARRTAEAPAGDAADPWVDALPVLEIQARLWLDDLAGADAVIAAARAAVHPPVVSEVWLPGLASLAELVRGELSEAERLATGALAAADDLGLHPDNGGRVEPQATLAALAIERDDLDDAGDRLDRLLRTVDGGRRPLVELSTHLRLAGVASARGDERAARVAIERARSLLPHATDPVTSHIDRAELRLALDRGDLGTAAALERRLSPSTSSALLAARVRLALDDRVGALDILDAVAARCSTRRLAVEHGVLRARAMAATEPARAREALHDTLLLAQPVGFHRTLLAEGPDLWALLASLPAHGPMADLIAQLLTAADHVVAAPGVGEPDGLVEPLSGREATVLRYLSSRLTCTEIADELDLSVHTVRSHVKAIYRKLGVSSRHDAVERAHALGPAGLARPAGRAGGARPARP